MEAIGKVILNNKNSRRINLCAIWGWKGEARARLNPFRLYIVYLYSHRNYKFYRKKLNSKVVGNSFSHNLKILMKNSINQVFSF